MKNQNFDFRGVCFLSYGWFCIQQWLTVHWGLKRFCKPDSDANQWDWGFNSKTCGIQGRSPSGGVGVKAPNFFLSRWIKCFSTIFFFKNGLIYMKNVFKRMKNQFSDFCNFSFLRYGHFCTQNWSMFQWIWSTKLSITQNKNRKNRKIYFLFVSAHCASLL